MKDLKYFLTGLFLLQPTPSYHTALPAKLLSSSLLWISLYASHSSHKDGVKDSVRISLNVEKMTDLQPRLSLLCILQKGQYLVTSKCSTFSTISAEWGTWWQLDVGSSLGLPLPAGFHSTLPPSPCQRLIGTSEFICIAHCVCCSSLKKISFYCLMKCLWAPIVFVFGETQNYGPFVFILGMVPFSVKNKEMCKMPLHFSSYLECSLTKTRSRTEYLLCQALHFYVQVLPTRRMSHSNNFRGRE